MSVASVRLNCGQLVCRLSSDSVTALLVQVERYTLTGGPHPAIAGSNVIVKPQTWQFSQRSIVRPHTYSVAAVGSRAAGRAHAIPAFLLLLVSGIGSARHAPFCAWTGSPVVAMRNATWKRSAVWRCEGRSTSSQDEIQFSAEIE